ncbi:MAG: hypothetical protein LBG44_01550 [Gemmatimonadota bacterium]|jgi:hypothetical protein|nr:hypothetical protein [Gemmatimonadota bacterium]
MSSGSSDNRGTSRVKLLFADRGEFHSITVTVPSEVLGEYDRLVDLLQEEPCVTRQLHVDMKRLVSAAVVEEGEEY